MSSALNRRSALGLGAAVAATVGVGSTASAASAAPRKPLAPTTPSAIRARIAADYQRVTTAAGGTWNSLITVVEPDGTTTPAVSTGAGVVLEAYSVNKIAVATAVLDKVDRGLLSLTQRVDVTDAIVVPGGDGIFSLDGAHPSSVTLGHVLAALLTISDDTAVRLCGLVAPAAEINQILVAKGFPNTQVEPVANPNRFYLGRSNAQETHDILRALVGGTLLSPASSTRLLNLLRSPIAFTDGVRRNMSSDQRARIATKAGWYDDSRHEAGIVFDAAGAPVVTYVLFAHGQADANNFGATHPAVQARADFGPSLLGAVTALTGAPVTRVSKPPLYRPSRGN